MGRYKKHNEIGILCISWIFPHYKKWVLGSPNKQIWILLYKVQWLLYLYCYQVKKSQFLNLQKPTNKK